MKKRANRKRKSIRKKSKKGASAFSEASYLCDSCGEEIVIPIDISAGADQQYIEDCPVCCCPNIVTVSIEEDGEIRCWGQRE